MALLVLSFISYELEATNIHDYSIMVHDTAECERVPAFGVFRLSIFIGLPGRAGITLLTTMRVFLLHNLQ